jgi:hypothetical protein
MPMTLAFRICRTRRTILATTMLCGLLATSYTAHAQGCIVARSPEQVLPSIDQNGRPLNQGGYLLPGQVQVTVGERHQFSYQHYVGDVYQEYRAQGKTQVENRINIVTTDVIYQWKPRISFELNAPWLFATRKAQNSPIKYAATGLGDTIAVANFWLWNPQKAARGNVSIGMGVLMPTGNDDVQNTVNTNTSGTGPPVIATVPVDYSIQPGAGGWGLAMQWQGYHTAGKNLVFYTDGDYIATQGGTNGVLRHSPPSTTTPLDNYNAISDQYLMEGGMAFPVTHVNGLAILLAARDEGVPAKNLFPNSNAGFRRPGYAVSAGPGAEYMRGPHILTASIFKAIHRDRTVSYPDEVYGTHGDAAFAQYVWLASYTYRF